MNRFRSNGRRDPSRSAVTDFDAAARQVGIGFRPVAFAVLAVLALAGSTTRGDTPRQLPAFTHRAAADWLNGEPPAGAGLHGRPLLIEVWTFECANCLASLPWMRHVAAEYRPRGLAVVGVHSPEFGVERDPAQVAAAVRRLGISYPVMLDADFSYWRALGNQYWPAFYLYDGEGHLIATRIGELHRGTPAADAFERLIASQLAPPAVAP